MLTQQNLVSAYALIFFNSYKYTNPLVHNLSLSFLDAEIEDENFEDFKDDNKLSNDLNVF